MMSENEKKIIMANIKIPLHVQPDGSITPMMDYIAIDIEPLEKLPEKVDTPTVQANFFDGIRALIMPSKSDLSQASDPPPTNESSLTVLPNEIHYHSETRPNNITFKNYKRAVRLRNTIKAR